MKRKVVFFSLDLSRNLLSLLSIPVERRKKSPRNAENESRGIFSKVKKMKRRRGRGEEKKKGGEKGEERKEGGKYPMAVEGFVRKPRD